jgi:hypothetical protein
LKSALAAEKDLANSDLLKTSPQWQTATGVVVFGVTEEQKRATGRVNIRDTNEAYERTLRRVAVSGIQPPIFGLGIHKLGDEGRQALALVIPASADIPHLIYRGEYFGAPIRNDADTVWMRERHLEAPTGRDWQTDNWRVRCSTRNT